MNDPDKDDDVVWALPKILTPRLANFNEMSDVECEPPKVLPPSLPLTLEPPSASLQSGERTLTPSNARAAPSILRQVAFADSNPSATLSVGGSRKSGPSTGTTSEKPASSWVSRISRSSLSAESDSKSKANPIAVLRRSLVAAKDFLVPLSLEEQVLKTQSLRGDFLDGELGFSPVKRDSEVTAKMPQPLKNEAEMSMTSEEEESAPPNFMEKIATIASWFVLCETSPIRRLWGMISNVTLAYVATVFPWRVCFIELYMGSNGYDDDSQLSWLALEDIIVVFFWIDLFLGFLTSYRDSKDREVKDIWLIARKYLTGWFFINLVACMPASAFRSVWRAILSSRTNSHTNSAARLAQLQRLAPARLVRFTMLVKTVHVVRSPMWNFASNIRVTRLLNLSMLLLWVAHIMACGWYLTAACSPQPEVSWIVRKNLFTASPGVQWLNSLYFILTVFTTVGFGDIAAISLGEVIYVVCTMIIGTVAHSIIVSEMISTLTSLGKDEAEVAAHMELVQEFARHCGLSTQLTKVLVSTVKVTARGVHRDIDKNEFRRIVNSHMIPRAVVQIVPQQLFGGRLILNNIFHPKGVRLGSNPSLHAPPARLPMLIAASSTIRHCECREVLHYNFDQALHLNLVLEGIFAHVALADPRHGGLAALPPAASMMNCNQSPDATTQRKRMTGLTPYRLFGPRSYFAEYEIIFGGIPRQACSRCESESGVLLQLPRADFIRFCEEFPRFGIAWRMTARRREQLRRRLLKSHHVARNFKNLAAYRIQSYVRAGVLGTDRPAEADGTTSVYSDGSSSIPMLGHTLTSGTLAAEPPPICEEDVQALRSEMQHLRKTVGSIQGMMESLRQDMMRVIAAEDLC